MGAFRTDACARDDFRCRAKSLGLRIFLHLFALVFLGLIPPGSALSGGAYSYRFPTPGEDPLALGKTVIGIPLRHITARKDTLLDIARLYDLGYNELQDLYPDLDPWVPPVGESLDIPSQWVLPGFSRAGIVINIPEMRLFYFMPRSGLVRTFPIGIGDIDWPSPIGKFKIIEKRPNPTWYIPASLQEKYGVKVMPPGPDNPLGDHWLGLSAPGYGIHGTNIPWSVGRLVTHGCIRLYPEDIQILFSTVGYGTPVEIIYAPVKIGILSGRIYAEAHQDIYRKLPDYYAYGYRLLRETGMSAQVDQQKFLRVLQGRNGMALDVTLVPY